MSAQIRRLGIALVVLFGALFAQLNYVQVVRADKLATDPRNTRQATKDFSRARGTIQTADGVVVARSVDVDTQFKRLRQYPEGPLFAHVTGYFSFTFGTDGVERTYAGELSGRDFDVRVRQLEDVLSDQQMTANVTLTISKRMQEIARQALGNKKGAVVAVDPTNGAVRALWSYPSYDPNPLAGHTQAAVQDEWDRLQDDANKPLLPRTYRERYFPGSTFKVVTAAAAIDREPPLVTKNYPVLRDLDLPDTDKNLPNFGGGRCGGTLPQLLKVSCNTGFAQMGLDLGAEDMAAEADSFGFDSRPPIDLPVVAQSVFPEASTFRRNRPALAQSAIGQQDVRASPLHMAMVAAAIGNGGLAMKPHVVAEVRNSEGEVVRRLEGEPWKRFTRAETAAAVRDMMVGVVNGGTATRAAVPGAQVAAKTGTAQTVGDNAHAWLIAFAPAEAPKIAVAVIVESQDGVTEATGGRVAAPIARTVMQAALTGP